MEYVQMKAQEMCVIFVRISIENKTKHETDEY